MRNLLVFLLLLPFSAQATIRLLDNRFLMTSDAMTAQRDAYVEAGGSSEDDPVIVYIPFAPDLSGTSTQDLNTLYTDIPALQGGTSIGTGAGKLFEDNPRFNAYIENRFTARKRIAVYAKTSSSYTSIPVQGGVGSNYIELDSYQSGFLNFTVDGLCSISGTSCNSFMQSLANDANSKMDGEQYVYVVAYETTEVPSTSTIDPEDFPNGFYIKIRMSVNYPTPPVTINSIKRGDTNLTVSYNGVGTLYGLDTYFYKLLILNTSTTVPANSAANLKTTLGVVTECRKDGEIYPSNCYIVSSQINQAGDVTAYNLVNGQDYKLSVVIANKFKFTSQIKQTMTGQPQEIEAFIKEQSCFFLSAGFQDQHYILDYFRTFRDTSLLKNTLGKMFVDSYYEYAPAYTHYIYNSPVMSSLMRGIGYALFWIIQGIVPLLCLGLAILAHRRLKRIQL